MRRSCQTDRVHLVLVLWPKGCCPSHFAASRLSREAALSLITCLRAAKEAKFGYMYDSLSRLTVLELLSYCSRFY